MAGTTFLRQYLNCKEQREVSAIYKKYHLTAINFNLACQTAMNRRESFNKAVNEMSNLAISDFVTYYDCFQRSWRLNTEIKVAIGKAVIPYIMKVMKKIDSENRKDQFEAMSNGRLSAEDLKEKYENDFQVNTERTSYSYSAKKKCHKQENTQRARFVLYAKDANGQKLKDSYGYFKLVHNVSFYIGSDALGYFDDSDVLPKLKEALENAKKYAKRRLQEAQQELDCITSVNLEEYAA